MCVRRFYVPILADFIKGSSHALSKGVDLLAQGQLGGAEAHGACARCRARSSSGSGSCTLRAASRVVLHLRWPSSVAARHDHHPHRAEQRVGAGRRGIMTEVTVLVAARRRAAVGRLMQRGRRSSAAVAEQTEYASEKLAHGQAVLDLQRAGHDHGRGRAWESVSRRVLARAGSGWVGRVAAGLGLGRQGRERSRLAEDWA